MVSIFKMCRKYLIKNKYCVIWYGFLCLTSSIFSMISPYISGNFIDYLIVADDISKIYQYCFVFFGLFVINQLIGYIVNRVYIKMQTQMGYELNSDVIRHIQRLPVSFLKKQNMAYLNQRVNNDSNQLITFCINIVQGILINSLKLLFSISLLVQFSSNITLLFVAIIGAYALSYKILKKILFEAQFILTEAQTNYFSKLFEQFDNILFVKMQAIYESFLSRLKREFQNILKVSLQYQKISYLFSSLDSLVMSLAQIGIFIMGGALVIRGKLSVGQLTIMLSYFGIMMEASRYFFSLTKTIQDNKVAYTRLKQILDLESDENAGVELKDIGQIRLKNIMFYYGKKCIFRDISLEFKKGKIYSIIGKNGIGKSTLVDLIIGFYNRELEWLNSISLAELQRKIGEIYFVDHYKMIADQFLYKKDFETSLFLRIAMETGIRSADIPCIEWSCMHGKTIILEETKRGDLYKKVNGTFPKISTQSLRIMKLLHRKQGKIFTKSNEYYVRKISCAWGMPGFRIHSFRDYRRKIEMGITAGVQVPRIIPL